MRKLIAFLLVFLLIASCASAELYPNTVLVTKVKDDGLELLDINGNIWFIFCDPEDWMVCDMASLIMEDNGTETVYDDIVMDIRYSGCFNDWGEIMNEIDDFVSEQDYVDPEELEFDWLGSEEEIEAYEQWCWARQNSGLFAYD